ncbi:recQ-mediated genome instability protein 1 [Nomia melanderi]|uniref:recQ-mediated genome instability protein 1 n=1 Tax=Nomia melanderi TaxID=2448451 RepID=UPI0013043509|nr:recQ-mediated genome instability protein 1-like [Nomia melanderi]XP_031831641.1 recQ-mediated genome instability protein 1-like [Nomia melanderi]
MNDDSFKRIKAKLKSEFYLMNDDWLRDCVEFYVDQHRNPSNEEIVQFVKVQWQLSDLREINNENGSLPPNISQHKFITLSENYILQVEQIYDIATSKYKQLQQIRNTHNIEVDTTEAEKLEKWEPPKKRMMQLKLTDGLQDIIGIEYNCISLFNETLLPGYKIMIIGPIKCRKGVLLLEGSKLKGIGGEVDSLLIRNALENVLARALNIEENPDPYNDNGSESNNNRQDEELQLDNESKSNNNKQDEELQLESSFFEDDFEINLDEVSKIEHSHIGDHKQSNANPCKIENIKENTSVKNNVKKKTNYNVKIETRKENLITNYVEKKTDNRNNEQNIFDDDDYLLEMIDEEQLVELQPKQKIATPFRSLPKEGDDDVIIINEDTIEDIKYKSIQKPIVKTQNILQQSSAQYTGETSSSINTFHSKLCDKPSKTSVCSIAGKRPIPMSSPEPVTSKKGKIDRKITEFTKMPSSPNIKIYDFIYDINNEIITEVIYKTIYGRVEILGKLSKNNSVWILDATIVDGTGKIEVTFSNQVLENLLGFSVQEFSIKKKLKKNPEIEHELRMKFRSAEQRIKTLNDLLELKLDVNKKPMVMKIIDVTQQQKELIDKQLKSFLSK